MLIYARSDNFDALWESYKNYCNMQFGGFTATCGQDNIQLANIKAGLTHFKGRDVYHLLVNFYS